MMRVALLLASLVATVTLRMRPRGARAPRPVRSTSEMEEEAKIRAKLEEYAREQKGRHSQKKLSPSAARRRKKRGASFEEAQEIGARLAREVRRCGGSELDAGARELLQDLVSTTAGARGWFVALLTDPDLGPLFEPPIDDALLEPIATRPEPNTRLAVMNVAMSAATGVAHAANGHAELAAASRETAGRSAALVKALLARDMPGLARAVRGLAEAVSDGPDTLEGLIGPPGGEHELDELEAILAGRAPEPADEWAQFLDKWGYDRGQRRAIGEALAPIVRGME